MNKEEKLKEQKKKAQKKYWEKHKEYYKEQSLNEAKRVRQERRIYKERINKAIDMLKELVSLYDDNYTVSDKAKDIIEILKGVEQPVNIKIKTKRLGKK